MTDDFYKKFIKNPHDGYFLDTFRDRENMISFLNAVLPGDIIKNINLPAIKFDPDSYLDEELSKKVSDLVVKTTIKSHKDKLPMDIYILFEHKSYKDNSILLQLLRYMFLMWKEDEKAKKPLRVIIPIVYYHGKAKWNIPLSFAEQFDVPEEIRKYLLNYTYTLFDTKDMDESGKKYKTITENIKLNARILLMKNIFEKNRDKIEEIFKFWYESGLENDRNFFEKSLTYIMFSMDISQEEIIELLEKNKIGGEKMPTLGQRLLDQGFETGLMEGMQRGKQEGIMEGIKKGIEKGILKGLNKGKEEKEKALILKMFKKGYQLEDISDITGLSKDKIKKIIKKQ